MIKSKHRLTSLILVVFLAISAFCACGFSVIAASTDENSVSAGGTLVYLKNSKNWNPVYIHYWGGSNETKWPGVLMNLVEGTTDVYYYEVPAGETGIVFNGGGNGDLQTGDLSVAEGSGKIYDPSTNKWSDYTEPVIPTDTTPTSQPDTTQPTTSPVIGDNVVYCQNDAGWSSVYCYMWNSSNDDNHSWPGVLMEDLGEGIWYYDIPKNYANIIFNSGSDANKTVDMTYPGTGHIYNNKTGKWDTFDTNPIIITDFTTDLASPQYKGMNITITSSAKSTAGEVSYKYTVTNTTTSQTIVLSNFSSANTVVWTPNAVGEYVITVDVTDTAGNQNQRTMNYSIADDSTLVNPLIKVVTPYDNSQVQINTQVTVNVNAGGGNTGTKLLFYKYIVTDPDGVTNTPYYSLSKSYQFTPTKLGEYKVQIYVQGSDNQTVSKTYTYTSVSKIVSSSMNSNQQGSLGDVNLDGEVNIKDTTEIQLYLAHYRTFTDEQMVFADYDCDGEINIKDATRVQFALANLV